MESKNYAEVLIGGHVYTLGGAEEEGYLQRVASYINEKMSQLKKQPGFTRQSADYQAVMVQLNLADDFFNFIHAHQAAAFGSASRFLRHTVQAAQIAFIGNRYS